MKHSILSDKLKALNLNPYITNWYLSFLHNRKQRLLFRVAATAGIMLTKAQHRAALVALTCLIIFVNDLDLVNCPEASLSKYADDTTMQVVVNKAENDCASDVISH